MKKKFNDEHEMRQYLTKYSEKVEKSDKWQRLQDMRRKLEEECDSLFKIEDERERYFMVTMYRFEDEEQLSHWLTDWRPPHITDVVKRLKLALKFTKGMRIVARESCYPHTRKVPFWDERVAMLEKYIRIINN